MSKLIKIAYVIDTIESPTAGTEKQLLLLIKNLNKEEFKPYLCVLRSSRWLQSTYLDSDYIPINFLSFKKLASYYNLYKYILWLKKEKIDVIQTYFVDGNKIGIIASKFAGVKYNISSRRNQGYWHNFLELLVLRCINHWVDLFISNANNTKEWVVKTEKITRDRISVIYNGIELEAFCKADEKERVLFRLQHGFKDDDILVGIVANLRPVKSLDIFLRAAQKVLEINRNVGFVLVGEGPERSALQELSRSLGVMGSVRFLGAREDIPSILGCLDIGVLSSVSESFSNAIVEYMAAGLPVVCTRVGGNEEAVDDNVTGYLVASGDYHGMAEKITSLIANSAYREMGQRGRRKAEKMFAVDRIVGHYQQIYRENA